MKYIRTLFDKPAKNGKFYLIAIDGRGGAGKSSFTDYLKKLLPDFDFIYYDDYFEPTPDKEIWGGFNQARFEADVIKPLHDSDKFIYRPYNHHKTPHITEQPMIIQKGLVLEGCFSFSFDLDWDLKIWVETPRELCLKRGVERDAKDKGYETALHGWRDIWLPPEDKYIEQIKPLETVDIVLDGTESFESQIN